MKRSWMFLFALSALTVLPRIASADAVTRCQRGIHSLPVTINSAGTYCLDRNLSMSATTGAAITVNANDVTVDLKGFKIDGSGAGAGTLTLGVSANGRRGLTVRNGRIRGFFQGIQVTGTGTTIEDLSLDSNTNEVVR